MDFIDFLQGWREYMLKNRSQRKGQAMVNFLTSVWRSDLVDALEKEYPTLFYDDGYVLPAIHLLAIRLIMPELKGPENGN